MKALIAIILVLALLNAAGYSPFRAEEPDTLNPIETIVAVFSDQGVTLTAEGGQTGAGSTFAKAVEDLKNTSIGTTFLQTAEKLVAVGANAADLASVALSDLMRPAAELFAASGAPDAERANDFLRTRNSDVTVGSIQEALAAGEPIPALPKLPKISGEGQHGED